MRLRQIARRSYAQYIQDIGKEPAPMVADYQAHIDHDVVFTACIDDEIVGFAVIIKKQDGFWLETIAVLPEQSGNGIGTAMITAVETYLRARTSCYQLYTNAKMTRNKTWYHRLGFTITDERNEKGFQRIFFLKTL